LLTLLTNSDLRMEVTFCKTSPTVVTEPMNSEGETLRPPSPANSERTKKMMNVVVRVEVLSCLVEKTAIGVNELSLRRVWQMFVGLRKLIVLLNSSIWKKVPKSWGKRMMIERVVWQRDILVDGSNICVRWREIQTIYIS